MLTREEILEIYEAGPEAIIASIKEFETIVDIRDSQIIDHKNPRGLPK